MQEFGKVLVAGGIVAVVIGALLWSGVGRGWIGRLPGDINMTGEKFSFHFPIVTCLIVSAVLSLIIWITRR